LPALHARLMQVPGFAEFAVVSPSVGASLKAVVSPTPAAPPAAG